MSDPSHSRPVESSATEAKSTNSGILEIKRLHSTHTIIENDFQKIATEIEKLNEKGCYKDWLGYNDRYISYIKGSRNIAAQSKEGLSGRNKIVAIFSGWDSTRPDVGGVAVDKYWKAIETLKDESRNLKTDFLRIKAGVINMQKAVQRIVKEQERKATDLDMKIKQLEDKLQLAMDDRVEEYAMENDKNILELGTLKAEQTQLKRGLLDASQVPTETQPIFKRMDDGLGALHEIWQRVWSYSLDFRKNLDNWKTSKSHVVRKNSAAAIIPMYDKLVLSLDEYLRASDSSTSLTEPMNADVL
jgi:hypothetical protein